MAWVICVSACVAPAVTDAGTGGSDAGVDAPNDAPSAVLTTCWASVDAVIARCEATPRPSPRGLCALRAYRGACTAGRPDVIAAVADCLVAAAPCSTARSSGTAVNCIAGVVASNRDGSQLAVDHAWCACSPSEIGCPDAPAVTGPELALIDDADAQHVTACLTSTCTMPTFCFGSDALGTALLQCDMIP
jgi:hypothetical protein